ncbi:MULTISPECIES: hypothetical protein [Desulfovibrio]|nr:MULTISPECIES: hypothetical protein [Desulfovibrio]MCQ4860213.1 hypothetical protein [Desulfovibrio desulfuricans]MCQ5216704.1 hypothetical protein [Desulfovibrio desulfuricans]MDE8728262.1 hypothetical protein [Desulfovibrio desulfuricans]MEA4991447.1 hypothetical protein [Desulfovibrio desulfuricans]
MKTTNIHQNRARQRSTAPVIRAARRCAATAAMHMRNMLEEALSC